MGHGASNSLSGGESTHPEMTAMLLDLQRHVLDVDLLDHSRLNRRHGSRSRPPNARTKIEPIVDKRAVDRFRWEGVAFVPRVTRLSRRCVVVPDPPATPAGRLDDVRRRRLGEVEESLPRTAQVALETCDRGLKPPSARTLLEHPTAACKTPYNSTVRTSVPWLSWLLSYIPDQADATIR